MAKYYPNIVRWLNNGGNQIIHVSSCHLPLVCLCWCPVLGSSGPWCQLCGPDGDAKLPILRLHFYLNN